MNGLTQLLLNCSSMTHVPRSATTPPRFGGKRVGDACLKTYQNVGKHVLVQVYIGAQRNGSRAIKP